jgi:ABC-type sugar transport system ATPase subunit
MIDITPHLGSFGLAIAAATKIFSTIERQSPIDPGSQDGDEPDDLSGRIEFRDIKHVYPSRPQTAILEDFNLTIDAGKIVAIVGQSGSGKSTLFGLLERFYLPLAGEVLLDGKDISGLNLKWLRRRISLVSQEPVIFNTTIYDCIAHGLIGTEHENVSAVHISLLLGLRLPSVLMLEQCHLRSGPACATDPIKHSVGSISDNHRRHLMLLKRSLLKTLLESLTPTISSTVYPRSSKPELENEVHFSQVVRSNVL